MIGHLTFDIFYSTLMENPHLAALCKKGEIFLEYQVIVWAYVSMIKYWLSASKLVIYYVYLSARNLWSYYS